MLAPRQHHLPIWVQISGKWLYEGRRSLQRQDVIDQELQAALALVLVHVETINELHGACRRDEAVPLFDVVEGNCIEGAPCSWDFDPHFQVTIADDARIPDFEDPVETRLGK